MAQLGLFLRRTAQNEFLPTQFQVKPIGLALKKHLTPEVVKMIEKARDTVETELTIDLYTSHYDLDTHRVQVWTSDLLKLSNMFWERKMYVSLDEQKKVFSIDSERALDALITLLDKIHPLEPQRNSKDAAAGKGEENGAPAKGGGDAEKAQAEVPK